MENLGKGFKRLSAASPQCQDTPAQFCTVFPDALAGKVPESPMGTPVALASECVIPTLIQFRRMATRLESGAGRDHRNRNYRWMYFLGFSVLLGGKLAGATAKLAGFDSRAVSENRRFLRLLRRGACLLRRMLRNTAALLGACGHAAAGLTRRIVHRVS